MSSSSAAAAAAAPKAGLFVYEIDGVPVFPGKLVITKMPNGMALHGPHPLARKPDGAISDDTFSSAAESDVVVTEFGTHVLTAECTFRPFEIKEPFVNPRPYVAPAALPATATAEQKKTHEVKVVQPARDKYDMELVAQQFVLALGGRVRDVSSPELFTSSHDLTTYLMPFETVVKPAGAAAASTSHILWGCPVKLRRSATIDRYYLVHMPQDVFRALMAPLIRRTAASTAVVAALAADDKSAAFTYGGELDRLAKAFEGGQNRALHRARLCWLLEHHLFKGASGKFIPMDAHAVEDDAKKCHAQLDALKVDTPTPFRFRSGNAIANSGKPPRKTKPSPSKPPQQSPQKRKAPATAVDVDLEKEQPPAQRIRLDSAGAAAAVPSDRRQELDKMNTKAVHAAVDRKMEIDSAAAAAPTAAAVAKPTAAARKAAAAAAKPKPAPKSKAQKLCELFKPEHKSFSAAITSTFIDRSDAMREDITEVMNLAVAPRFGGGAADVRTPEQRFAWEFVCNLPTVLLSSEARTAGVWEYGSDEYTRMRKIAAAVKSMLAESVPDHPKMKQLNQWIDASVAAGKAEKAEAAEAVPSSVPGEEDAVVTDHAQLTQEQDTSMSDAKASVAAPAPAAAATPIAVAAAPVAAPAPMAVDAAATAKIADLAAACFLSAKECEQTAKACRDTLDSTNAAAQRFVTEVKTFKDSLKEAVDTEFRRMKDDHNTVLGTASRAETTARAATADVVALRQRVDHLERSMVATRKIIATVFGHLNELAQFHQAIRSAAIHSNEDDDAGVDVDEEMTEVWQKVDAASAAAAATGTASSSSSSAAAAAAAPNPS